MSDRPRYWFPAKRYGYGWGPPSTWEGWVVLIAGMVLLGIGPSLLPPDHPLPLLVYVLSIVGTIIAICYAMGEPPSWRWGGKDKMD